MPVCCPPASTLNIPLGAFEFLGPEVSFIKIKVQPSPVVQTPLVPEGFLVLHGSKSLLSASHLGTETLDFCVFLASYMELTVFHRMQGPCP